MATKARQQYFADETSISKESREFAIADSVQQKIDSIETWAQVNVIETVKVNWTALLPDGNKAVDISVPDVIDNLYTTDADDALSAKQWKILYDYIQSLQSLGKFLSNWNSATWLPTTNPSESPYAYHSWDYYIVSNVATAPATNYRPNGSSYTIWQASTTAETDSVNISDFYFYDWTNWLLLWNSARTIAVDTALSTTSTNPVENRVVTNAINWKQATLTASTGISIDWNNNISNTLPWPTIAATAPTGTEWALWYDTTTDKLKSYDGTNWNVVWDDSANINTKTFYITTTWTSATAKAEWQAVYDWYAAGKNPIVIKWDSAFILRSTTSSNLFFHNYSYTENWNSSSKSSESSLMITYSNGVVSQISMGTMMTSPNVLATDVNYSTPYTPTYNWSPATKKYVDDRDTYIGSSAPTSNLVEWRLWYDTTNDQLKVYDWTNWNVTGKEYNAWPWISIGTYNDYSAMQWPAPEGFHIPSDTEWTAVKTVWTTLWGWSSDWTNFGIALKLPFAGKRRGSSASVASQGTDWSYWSSIGDTTAKLTIISSSSINTGNSTSKWNCNSIRPFKDTPVTPTSSWTKLYWTSIESWWIFWNSTDWLISLSSDGSNWLTIADKNLWATTVWNSWDTLSEANCGWYFQWGNNYMFPFTWTVTTSSTQVDASNYWPWNYYSSSTFITWYGDRSSVNNDDLWWWETWVVTINDAITNTGVLSVNGETGDVTVEESNTKTFYLSSTSDLTTAQAALDWYLAGKNPIVVFSWRAYLIQSKSSSKFEFYSYTEAGDWTSTSTVRYYQITFTLSWATVSSITAITNAVWPFLKTNIDYTTPYTPTYNWSPATKKYVDDKVAEAISNDTTWTTTTITKIWAWTETEFANLQTKDSSTIYYTF